MQNMLAHRITTLPPSGTIAMHQKAMELQQKGHHIINLSIGAPTFQTPLAIQRAAKQAIDTGRYFAYAPVAGYADLREAIAAKLYQENNISCAPEQVIVSNGAKQTISNVFASLLNPGDEVVVYTPAWGSYGAIIQWVGGKPVPLQGSMDDNFAATPEQLEQALSTKTKAVIFSSPCNPTGHVFSRQALEGMATLLAKYPHVVVIADEIYEHINFTDKHISIGAIPTIQDRVVTINGFSKGFAMAGWRIGYMAAPMWLASACEKLQGQTTGAPSSIAQRAALAALRGDKQVLQHMNKAYRMQRDLCLELLTEIPGIRVNTPLGALFLFPDVSHYFGYTDGYMKIIDADTLCRYLLEKAHVSLVPGHVFGEPKCIRISYTATEAQLRIALQRIKDALHALRPFPS